MNFEIETSQIGRVVLTEVGDKVFVVSSAHQKYHHIPLGTLERDGSKWKAVLDDFFWKGLSKEKTEPTKKLAVNHFVTALEYRLYKDGLKEDLNNSYKDANQTQNFINNVERVIKNAQEDIDNVVNKFTKDWEKGIGYIHSSIIWNGESVLRATHLTRWMSRLEGVRGAIGNTIKESSEFYLPETATLKEFVERVQNLNQLVKKDVEYRLLECEDWRHNSSGAMWNIDNLAQASANRTFYKLLVQLDSICESTLNP